jgi:hypothetical protein
LFQSKIEKFLVKRVLLLFVILEVVVILLMKDPQALSAGLFAGGIFSVLRLKAMADLLSRILFEKTTHRHANSSIAGFIIAQAAAALLLILALWIHNRAFIGAAAGILLVPAVVTVNSITEGLHFTNNNFE